MTDESHNCDAFARALQTAYQEVRMHSPQGIAEVEERLRRKLDLRGVTLTPDILRALSFAVVKGRDL